MQLYHHAKSNAYFRVKNDSDKIRSVTCVGSKFEKPICDFYLRGHCTYGDSCRKQHIKAEDLKEDDSHSDFRKLDRTEDAAVFDKLRKVEEMRKAMSKTDFVKWEGATTEKNAGPSSGVAVGGVVDAVDLRPVFGRVRQFDPAKGVGYIVPDIVKASPAAPAGSDLESEEDTAVFVHRKNVVGSTATQPVNLKVGARVEYRLGKFDGRPACLEVMMVDAGGKPLGAHCTPGIDATKKKLFYVTAEGVGVRHHSESWPGRKQQLQDRVTADEPLEELGCYFAVFDGHGGTQIADGAAKALHRNILATYRARNVQVASRDATITAAVKAAFLQTDKELLEGSERKGWALVGSTAVVVILHGNPRLNVPLRLVVANLGDSRAVLCRAGDAVALTEDHKPEVSVEKRRAEKAGGLVLEVRGTMRIAASANPNLRKSKEYQGLAMTRSFGDLYFKQPHPIIIAEPDITVHKISEKDMFVVLATDGIFDVLSNQATVDLALKHVTDPEEAAKNIVRTAFQKGSEDNITAMVVQLGYGDKGAATWAKQRLRQAAWEAKKKEDEGASSPKATATLEDIVANQKSKKKGIESDDFDMFG